jgi:hypothetical protein
MLATTDRVAGGATPGDGIYLAQTSHFEQVGSPKQQFPTQARVETWRTELTALTQTRCREVAQDDLIARHPHIFTPAFFVDPPGAGPPACDTLFLSYAPADVALATWIARRLIAEGYRVWCEDLSLLAGEQRQQTIERVIQTRAIRVLACTRWRPWTTRT